MSDFPKVPQEAYSVKTETPYSWTNSGALRPGRLWEAEPRSALAELLCFPLLGGIPRLRRAYGDLPPPQPRLKAKGIQFPLLKSTLSLVVMSTLIYQENVELLGAAFYF